MFALFSRQARPWIGAYRVGLDWVPMSWTHEGMFYAEGSALKSSLQDIPELAVMYDKIKS